MRPVAVAPTYDNASTLREVLDRIAATGVAVIVVNDGSTDETATLVESWIADRGDTADEVVTHDVNRGKAAALVTGFTRAIERGFTHAVTMDTDGQLDPEQIPELLAVSESHPAALVVGARDDSRPDYPQRSRVGRRWSNLAIRVESGAASGDASGAGELIFEVSDNGPGIDPRYHDRIFRIFETLAPRDKVEGSGMGLALVKKIVQAHGGRIWLESQGPGQGSRFSFSWPTGE